MYYLFFLRITAKATSDTDNKTITDTINFACRSIPVSGIKVPPDKTDSAKPPPTEYGILVRFMPSPPGSFRYIECRVFSGLSYGNLVGTVCLPVEINVYAAEGKSGLYAQT